MPFIDPNLQQALAAAEDSGQSLSAVFVLKATPTNAALSELVDALLAQAAQASGHVALRKVLFSQLGSFSIEAPAAFLGVLAQSPSISASLLNEDDTAWRV